VAAGRGDQAAFEELYKRTHRAVYSAVRTMVRSEEDALELTQDTYLDAWRSLPSLRSPAAFRTWLFRIAANKARDHRKRRLLSIDSLEERQEGGNGGEPVDPREGPPEVLVAGERRRRVQEAMEGLTEEHRAVISLFYGAGLGVTEVAGALGVPRGTVLSRLARARDALRKRLLPYLEDRDEV
jgi:RNA polymerase sigma-70 factor (ECF subfamily)